MKLDEYGEVLNSPETFESIAVILQQVGSCLIGWTDEEGTHFDILFTWRVGNVPSFGTLQGGVKGSDLFISIMRIGSFGFELKNSDTDGGYYEEKLVRNMNLGSTREAIAELINGVKKYLI